MKGVKLHLPPQLKRICHNCKKPGHMARDCGQEKTNDFKNMRPCKHCGGMHMDSKCWALPQNAEWKSKRGKETANVACDIRRLSCFSVVSECHINRLCTRSQNLDR
jgi:hypothetical protein